MTDQPADGTLTTEKKLSLNWHSNAPWAPTGYGNQTKVFVPRIKDLGYPVSITAFYGLQGGRMWLNDGTVVYPVGNHPYGQDILGAHAMHSGANAIITLMDAWVVQPENALGLPWYPWFPIDCEPIPANVYAMVKQATSPLLSKFGRIRQRKWGWTCTGLSRRDKRSSVRPQRIRHGIQNTASSLWHGRSKQGYHRIKVL